MKNNSMKLIAIIFSLFCFVELAEANRYWVSPSGTDGQCTNSSTQPALAAMERTVAGSQTCVLNAGGSPHTVSIKTGTYVETLGYIGAFIGSSPSSQITFEAVDGIGTVILSGTADPAVINLEGSSPTRPTSQYVTIKGIVVDATHAQGAVAAGNFTSFIDVEMINTSKGADTCPGIGTGSIPTCGAGFPGTRGGAAAILVSPGLHDNLFLRVKVHDGTKGTVDQGGGNCCQGVHGGYISGYRNTFDNIEVYRMNQEGLQFFHFQGDPTLGGNVVKNSRFHDIGSFYTPGMSGDGVITYGERPNEPELTFNNSFWNVDVAMATGTNNGHVFYNNTVYSSGNGYAGGGGCSTCILKNNIFFNVGNQILQSVGYTLPNSSNNLCGSSQTGCQFVGNPNFVNAASFNFNLQSPSPAIDVGTANITASISIQQCPTGAPNCFNGPAPDIGAFETVVGNVNPLIALVTPTKNNQYTTNSATLNLTGTSSDPDGTVAKVTWVCDRCGSGNATNTGTNFSTWSINNITLQSGDNVIDITATDNLGSTTVFRETVTLTVVTHYVSASNGVNSGTCLNVNAPCLTIGYGISQLASGETLSIRGGTYAEGITDIQLAGKSGGGSYATATVIQAFGTEVVTLTGGIGLNNNQTLSYVIFKADPVAHNFIVPTIRVGQLGNTNVVGNIKFDGLEVGNIVNSDAIIATGQNGAGPLWFTHLKVHGATGCANNGAGPQPVHGFYIQSPNNILEYSEIYNVTGLGVQNYDEAGGQAINNIYRFNTWHDIAKNQPGNCVQTAFPIGMYTGSGHQLYGNTVYTSVGGIQIQTSNTVAYNNTVWNVGNGTVPGWCCYSAISIGGSGANAVVKNNIVFNNNVNAIDPSTTQSNNRLTDPLFTNAAIGDFTLQPNSLAINAGTPTITASISIPACTGANAPNCYFGSAPDIGAYEFGAPTISITQPTTNPTYNSSSATVDLSGNAAAASPATISSVTWSCDVCGSGTATVVAATWSVTAITLRPGPNSITVTATDSNKQTATANIGITYVAGGVGGIVLKMDFEEPSGTQAIDSSGNFNNGTLGANVTRVAGKVGNALHFDGTPTSVVTIPDSSSFHVGAVTIEAWVRPTVQAFVWRTIFANSAYWLFTDTTGKCGNGAVVGGFLDAALGPSDFCDPTALSLNTWTHIAMTYDPSIPAPQMKYYKNGALVASATYTGAISYAGIGASTIGNDSNGEAFTGDIDSIRIYGRALTQAEILAEITSLQITSPTTPTYITTASTITISGTASCPATIGSVTWSSNRGGNQGTAKGTSNWSADIPLVPNRVNDLTFTVNCQ